MGVDGEEYNREQRGTEGVRMVDMEKRGYWEECSKDTVTALLAVSHFCTVFFTGGKRKKEEKKPNTGTSSGMHLYFSNQHRYISLSSLSILGRRNIEPDLGGTGRGVIRLMGNNDLGLVVIRWGLATW